MIYRGYRHSKGLGHQLVTKDNDFLDPTPSQKIWNHSPDGFNWGYLGSGPAQLALALLYDVTKDEVVAVRLHQEFKRSFVAAWGDTWEITDAHIREWVSSTLKEAQFKKI
ncbi:hypothetical protein ES706_05260 [subsurface metagenome]